MNDDFMVLLDNTSFEFDQQEDLFSPQHLTPAPSAPRSFALKRTANDFGFNDVSTIG
jgi:hypothetical protein